jgi:hypothetical protein
MASLLINTFDKLEEQISELKSSLEDQKNIRDTLKNESGLPIDSKKLNAAVKYQEAQISALRMEQGKIKAEAEVYKKEGIKTAQEAFENALKTGSKDNTAAATPAVKDNTMSGSAPTDPTNTIVTALQKQEYLKTWTFEDALKKLHDDNAKALEEEQRQADENARALELANAKKGVEDALSKLQPQGGDNEGTPEATAELKDAIEHLKNVQIKQGLIPAPENSNPVQEFVQAVDEATAKGEEISREVVDKFLAKISEVVQPTKEGETTAEDGFKNLKAETQKMIGSEGEVLQEHVLKFVETVKAAILEKVGPADKASSGGKNEPVGLIDNKHLNKTGKHLVSINKEFEKSFKTASKIRFPRFKLKKDVQDAEKPMKKVETLGERIKKSLSYISVYRFVRNFLHQMYKALKQGFQEYVKISDSTNKAMSNISSSWNAVAGTLGVALGSVITSLEPLISNLLDTIVAIVNEFNKFMAILNDQSTYDKVIKKTEDYAESLEGVNNQLFSFDKFETLSGGDEAHASYVTESVSVLSDETKEKLGLDIDISEAAGAIKELKELIDNIKKAFENLEDTIGISFVDILKGVAIAIVFVAVAITALIVLVATIVKGIEKFCEWLKTVDPIISGLVGSIGILVAGLIALAMILFFVKVVGGLKGGILALVTGIAAAVAITAIVKSIITSAENSKPNIKGFAKGGEVEDGLFYMSKGEISGSFYDGSTYITNQTKGESTFANVAYDGTARALNDYMSGSNNGSSSSGGTLEVVFNLDGRTLGRQLFPHIKAEHQRVGGSI